MELFRNKGFNATGVAEIVESLGITNAALYYYFASKQELLYAVLEGTLTEHLEVLEDIANSDATGRERLTRAVENHLDLIFHRPDAVRVFLRERRFLEAELAINYQKRVKRYDELFDQLISDCFAEQGDAANPRLMRLSVLGMLNWITEWYDPSGETDEAQIRSILCSFVMDRLLRGEHAKPVRRRGG